MNNKIIYRFVLNSIWLILLSMFLLSSIAHAEIEINVTLEDNLIILIDYSGSTFYCRDFITSNALYSIQSIESDNNASVVVFGGFIKNSSLYPMGYLENKNFLKEFVLNITGETGDLAYSNIDEGFKVAKKILNKSTGTKQIVLISDGNFDNTDVKIKTIKELQEDNIKIHLFQVSTTSLNPSLKIKFVEDSYKDLADKLNTKVIIINPDEKIRFIKEKPAISYTEIPNSNSSQKPVNMSPEVAEYLNEFSNDNEKITVIKTIYYNYPKGSFYSLLSQNSKKSFFSTVPFYSICNQTCIIVPFDVTERKFFNKLILEDVFINKNAIELVQSGNVTESAYTFSKGFDLCEYYGFDTFKEESINLGIEIAPSVLPKNAEKMAKRVKNLQNVGIISKYNPTTFIVSATCSAALKEEKEAFIKIASCRGYVKNLRNEFAYYGIVDDLQNCNKEATKSIIKAKNSFWVKVHGFVQLISKPFTPFIKLFYNCWNNECRGDISIDKTNMEIFDEALASINKNSIRLSTQSYDSEVISALERIDEKSTESNIWINNARNKYDELDSQIPFMIYEKISNFLIKPEINYATARIKQTEAEHLIEIAVENHEVYKFNSAIKNSEYSIAKSDEGLIYANKEKSKKRYLKDWFKMGGGLIISIISIFLIFKIIKYFETEK